MNEGMLERERGQPKILLQCYWVVTGMGVTDAVTGRFDSPAVGKWLVIGAVAWVLFIFVV